ncbi:MAG: hypothetical protein ACRC92_27090 [Peptostreptococcaceae bacterium]
MRNYKIPVSLITGEYVTKSYSHTVLTMKDDSLERVVEQSTENYNVIQPIVCPSGVTDENITFEGSNALTAFDKMFPNINSLAYGPMSTYAREALLSGFKVTVLNMRLEDSTYANAYVAMDVRVGTKESEKLTVYVHLDPETSYYTISTSMDDFEQSMIPDVKEVKVPKYIIDFKPFTIEGVKMGYIGTKTSDRDTRITAYLKGLFADTISTSASATVAPEDKFHLPIIGLFYRGRGSYGNTFTLNFSDSPNLTEDKYPTHVVEVKNQDVVEHKFDFNLFDITKYKLNMSFADRARDTCKITFTSTNKVETFRAYSVERKEAMKITPMLDKIVAKMKATIIAGIQEQFVGFTESSESDLNFLLKDISEWRGVFIPPRKQTMETPLSYVDIFKEHKFTSPQPVEFSACPTVIPLTEGKDGILGDLVDQGDFDWKATVTLNGNEVKPWEQMLLDYFNGVTDRSIYDPAMVRDGIIFGEGYPVKVQQAIDELTHYKKDIFNYDKSRPDFAYIRTPDDTISTMEDVFTWQKSFLNDENMAIVPNIGRFRFTDPYTGCQVYYSGFFSYLGKNGQLYSYLKSGSKDPFASGAWSIVNKAAENSQELIPKDEFEYTSLKGVDISYFTMQSTGKFKLGEEVAYNPGFTSVMKNLGSIINRNRILNIAYLILRDNRIISTSTTALDDLRDAILTAIKPYMAHFQDNVTVTVGVSQHPEEEGKDIVLADVQIFGESFSSRNRLAVTTKKLEKN